MGDQHIMNKTIYFPAISFNSQLLALTKEKHLKTGKGFEYWNKGNIFHYPYLLISAGHSFKNIELQKKINFDLKKGILLGDSGGFQLATMKLENTKAIKEKLFNWLENNSNYALTLDYPPYVSTQYKNKIKGNWFEERLGYSIENFNYFKENASGRTKYLNVLHGRESEAVNKWYCAVKDYEFPGGWAIGSAAVNLYYILYSFFYLFSKGEFSKYSKKAALIHILGLSKPRIMMYLSYLQLKLNRLGLDINISYDSSYPIQTAGWGHYFLFEKLDGITNLTITNRIIKENKYINLDANLPCFCPICKKLKFKDLFSFKNEKGTGFNLSYYLYNGLHNIYKFIAFKEHLESLIFTDNEDIYSSIFNSKNNTIFKIIDKAFNDDDPPNIIYRNKRIITKIDSDPANQSNKLDNFIEE